MAVDNPAGWLQNAGSTHTAEQMRTYIGGLLNGLGAVSSTVRTRGGVVPQLGTAMVVTQNGTPNMTVNVGSGLAYVEGTESATQGLYAVRAPTITNVTIAAAPGAGLNRIDLIIAQVLDSGYSGVSNFWQLQVVTGTAAASPVAPAPFNNSLVLAQVFVGALVTSIVTGNITDTRRFMAAAGGNTPCTTLTRPSILYDGLSIFEYDSNLYSWTDGANWFPQSQWVQGANIWYEPTGSNTLTSTTYANVVLDTVTRTITFTKRYASTRLKVSFNCVCTQPNAQWFLGVNINGSDFDVRRAFVNAAIGTFHLQASGERYIGGISAGAMTATARYKSASGSVGFDTNDTFSMTVEEVQ